MLEGAKCYGKKKKLKQVKGTGVQVLRICEKWQGGEEWPKQWSGGVAYQAEGAAMQRPWGGSAAGVAADVAAEWEAEWRKTLASPVEWDGTFGCLCS